MRGDRRAGVGPARVRPVALSKPSTGQLLLELTNRAHESAARRPGRRIVDADVRELTRTGMSVPQQAGPSTRQVGETAPTGERSREVHAGVVQVLASRPGDRRSHDDRPP